MLALMILPLETMAEEGELEPSQTLFIQSLKAQVKAEPSTDSKTLVELKRGDSVKFLAAQDLWYQIETGKEKGWVSRLFVGVNMPVGAANLNKDVKTDLAKASRKRSSSYTVSAAARGLAASERLREGREEFQADFEGLNSVEQEIIVNEELDNFESSAKLQGK